MILNIHKGEVASKNRIELLIKLAGRSIHPPVYSVTCALFSQITDRSEAASSAVDSMEVKHGEPLVVQFAAP